MATTDCKALACILWVWSPAAACSDPAQQTVEGHAEAEAALFGGVVATGELPLVDIAGRCTGVALAPRLVVYAAHCGTNVASVSTRTQAVGTVRCKALSEVQVPVRDLAYCLLEQDVETGADFPVPALGCELGYLVAGGEATVVGLGEPYFEERSARVIVSEVNEESLVLESEGVGACAGDSGGPILLRLSDGNTVVERIVGLISAAHPGCAGGPIAATKLAPFMEWLEAESGLDLSPCGSALGDWQPTRDCVGSDPVAPVSTLGLSTGSDAWVLCGLGYQPPAVAAALTAVAIRGVDDVTASIDGHGLIDCAEIVPEQSIDVRSVMAEIRLRDSGRKIWSSSTTLSPYRFGPLVVPIGRYRFAVQVLDYEGANLDAEREFTVHGPETVPSCAGAAGGPTPGSGILQLLLTVSFWRRRVLRSRAARSTKAS